MAAQTLKVLAMAGDGPGPELARAALKALSAVGRRGGLEILAGEALIHGLSYEKHGDFLRDEAVALAKNADAVLVGAIGGEKWEALARPGSPAAPDGLTQLHLGLGASIGVRPAVRPAALTECGALKPDALSGLDILLVRDMTIGGWEDDPSGSDRVGEKRVAIDAVSCHEDEVAKLARTAFSAARRRRKRVLSVARADRLYTGALWRDVVFEVERSFPEVAVTHLSPEAALTEILASPRDVDVILADAFSGETLNGLLPPLAGGRGILAAASFVEPPVAGGRARGIFWAPAGFETANPIGAILSAALLLEHAAGRPDLGAEIELAVARALDRGLRRGVLGGAAPAAEATAAFLAEISAYAAAAASADA